MKTVIVIRHIYFEDIGILEDELVKMGFLIKYIEAPLADFTNIDFNDCELVIVLGALIGAFDDVLYPFLIQEMAFIKKIIKANKNLLGICLGAQLIARALKVKVNPMRQKEIGFFPIKLNRNIKENPLISLESIPVLHWHGDQFDIPPNCYPLAFSERCPNQAFTYKNNVLALQFHMEANPEKIEQWLVGHSHELHSAKINLHQLRNEAKQYSQPLIKAGKETFLTWFTNLKK